MSGDPDLARLPTQSLKGVGDKLAARLTRLGITTVEHLLFHLPSRYEDRTRLTPVGALQPNTSAQIEAEVLAADIVFGRRRSLMVKIGDSSGVTTLRFFHFSSAQRQGFRKGRPLRCFGEVRRGRSGLEIYHPEYQFLDEHPAPLEKTLTPVYPTTEGVTQQRLRLLTDQALQLLRGSVARDLLEGYEDGQQWSLRDALFYLHRPPENARVEDLQNGRHPAQQRLIMEELLAHQLSMLQVRKRAKSYQAPRIEKDMEVERRLLDGFGFSPTKAQLRVEQEIALDLARGHPMLRLLQGDVGSGKTLVAALAAGQAIAAGYQAALMVPTEILAEQHQQNFDRWFSDCGWKTSLLTSRLKGKGKEALLKLIATGKADLVIGTHALFQAGIEFRNLALVIIDEQHRFGVNQRLALQDKGRKDDLRPHQLVMTATPIPRTLAMSHYAHLDLSVIDELPPGRKPVTTTVISQDRRSAVLSRVEQYCGDGHQVYWICTLIEEGEMENLKAAQVAAEELSLAMPDLRVGLIHGRLKSAEKEKIMAAFAAGEIDLLVATTVVEVGVDVPNASLMVIENPERLGLSQLHQLRGRVGRGQVESHCILLYGNPLSLAAKQRLSAMRSTTSGFELAEIDLRLRGAGELLGLRQTGEASFHLVQLERDAGLIPRAKQIAGQMLEKGDARVALLTERWLSGKQDYSFS